MELMSICPLLLPPKPISMLHHHPQLLRTAGYCTQIAGNCPPTTSNHTLTSCVQEDVGLIWSLNFGMQSEPHESSWAQNFGAPLHCARTARTLRATF